MDQLKKARAPQSNKVLEYFLQLFLFFQPIVTIESLTEQEVPDVPDGASSPKDEEDDDE